MKISNMRRKLAITIDDMYFDAHYIGGNILEGARVTETETLCHKAHRELKSPITKAAALLSTTTRVAVHAGLFIPWVSAYIAQDLAFLYLYANPPDFDTPSP